MAIFTFEDNSSIGTVFSVDTATLIIKVDELEKLRKLQVNHLVAIQSSKAGQHLIGIINRITRKASDEEQPVGDDLGLNNFLLIFYRRTSLHPSTTNFHPTTVEHRR